MDIRTKPTRPTRELVSELTALARRDSSAWSEISELLRFTMVRSRSREIRSGDRRHGLIVEVLTDSIVAFSFGRDNPERRERYERLQGVGSSPARFSSYLGRDPEPIRLDEYALVDGENIFTARDGNTRSSIGFGIGLEMLPATVVTAISLLNGRHHFVVSNFEALEAVPLALPFISSGMSLRLSGVGLWSRTGEHHFDLEMEIRHVDIGLVVDLLLARGAETVSFASETASVGSR